MRAMMALVLHLGGVGECGRLIWEWSVHSQESGDLHWRRWHLDGGQGRLLVAACIYSMHNNIIIS
jgi:hypothetical protein